MHKFYYELESKCNDRDRIVINIRTLKGSIRIIDENISRSLDIGFIRNRNEQRSVYVKQVNNLIEDLKSKRKIIKRYFDGSPSWRSVKSKDEQERIDLIVKKSKENISKDIFIYEVERNA